jgi:hypothetical protein
MRPAQMSRERADLGVSVELSPPIPSGFGAALIPFPRHEDRRGRLTGIEEGIDLPFARRRLYYISDVPPGEVRGDHAHRHEHTLLIPLVGSFKVNVDDGHDRVTFLLEDPSHGLLIPPHHWLRAYDFQPGSLCLALSSHTYDEHDYWRDYAEFRLVTRTSV